MLTIRLAPEIAKLIIWYFVIDITSPRGGKADNRPPMQCSITKYFQIVKVDEINFCGYNFTVNDFCKQKRRSILSLRLARVI